MKTVAPSDPPWLNMIAAKRIIAGIVAAFLALAMIVCAFTAFGSVLGALNEPDFGVWYVVAALSGLLAWAAHWGFTAASKEARSATKNNIFVAWTFISLLLLAVLVKWVLLPRSKALPPFARKGLEESTKGNLGAIRHALGIYYRDMDGQYPADLAVLTAAGKYLPYLPEARVRGHHPETSDVHYGTKADDAGGWLYNNVIGDAGRGTVLVNCTHTDYKGSEWSSY
jgi:hypothetical protein